MLGSTDEGHRLAPAVMQFITINDSLAPIRLVRFVDALSNAGLAEFLRCEREFKQRNADSSDGWVDVFDCRSFVGLSEEQRELCLRWLVANNELVRATSLGVALVVPARLTAPAKRVAAQLGSALVAAHVGDDLDEALYWALERAYDEDTWLAPALVIGGIDALRETMK